MTEEEFYLRYDAAIKELLNEELDDLEFESALYKRVFGESIPPLEYDLSGEAQVLILKYCLAERKSVPELGEDELLHLQYECQFKKSADLIGNYCSPINTAAEERATLRECLKAGKPYELPEEVKKLMEQGVDF